MKSLSHTAAKKVISLIISLCIHPNHVCVWWANGVGKSTLLKLITGDLSASEGSLHDAVECPLEDFISTVRRF